MIGRNSFMDHRGCTKPSATREVYLFFTLTLNFDQCRASVQVNISEFLHSYDGTINDWSCILLKLLNEQNPTEDMMFAPWKKRSTWFKLGLMDFTMP